MRQLSTIGEDFSDPSVVGRYLNHLTSARGVVRTEVTRRHLSEVALREGVGLQVVDIGCGDGRDALWLASLGHAVVGVDPSEEMIEHAYENLDKHVNNDGPLKGSVEFRVSNLSEMALKSAGEYDVTLSHGVMMYTDDPWEFISQHIELLREGGMLSLLTKNAYAQAYRAAGRGNYADARRLLTETDSMGNLGLKVESHTTQGIADIGASLGCMVVSWAGVRIFSDLDFDTTDSAELVALEWESARRSPYRDTAALIHLMLRKGLTLEYLEGNSAD